MVSDRNGNETEREPRRLKRSSVLKFWFGMAVIAAFIAARILLPNGDTAERRNLDLEGRILEPSGLSWHPQQGTLIVVGDEGQVAELTLQGDLVREKQLGGDFEGVATDPDRRILYVVDEKSLELSLLNWANFEEVGRLDLRPIIEDAGLSFNQEDSFEGIAYQSAPGSNTPGTLWLGYQYNPVAILRVDVEGTPPVLTFRDMHEVALKEISSLCIDPSSGQLVAVDDSQDLMAGLSERGEVLWSQAIGGTDQEGVVVLPDGSYCIADDLGGVFHYPAGAVR